MDDHPFFGARVPGKKMHDTLKGAVNRVFALVGAQRQTQLRRVAPLGTIERRIYRHRRRAHRRRIAGNIANQVIGGANRAKKEGLLIAFRLNNSGGYDDLHLALLGRGLEDDMKIITLNTRLFNQRLNRLDATQFRHESLEDGIQGSTDPTFYEATT